MLGALLSDCCLSDSPRAASPPSRADSSFLKDRALAQSLLFTAPAASAQACPPTPSPALHHSTLCARVSLTPSVHDTLPCCMMQLQYQVLRRRQGQVITDGLLCCPTRTVARVLSEHLLIVLNNVHMQMGAAISRHFGVPNQPLRCSASTQGPTKTALHMCAMVELASVFCTVSVLVHNC
jgi:hypothetical protein